VALHESRAEQVGVLLAVLEVVQVRCVQAYLKHCGDSYTSHHPVTVLHAPTKRMWDNMLVHAELSLS